VNKSKISGIVISLSFFLGAAIAETKDEFIGKIAIRTSTKLDYHNLHSVEVQKTKQGKLVFYNGTLISRRLYPAIAGELKLLRDAQEDFIPPQGCAAGSYTHEVHGAQKAAVAKKGCLDSRRSGELMLSLSRMRQAASSSAAEKLVK
jgi:hypothetical protein